MYGYILVVRGTPLNSGNLWAISMNRLYCSCEIWLTNVTVLYPMRVRYWRYSRNLLRTNSGLRSRILHSSIVSRFLTYRGVTMMS